MHLIFWDLGGQAGLRSIWDKYYAETNALIYLIDSSARSYLQSLLPSSFRMTSVTHGQTHCQ